MRRAAEIFLVVAVLVALACMVAMALEIAEHSGGWYGL